jgi:hypothetical protein
VQFLQVDFTVKRARQVPTDLEPDLQVSLQRARVNTVKALADASRLADTEDYQGARIVLEKTLEKVAALVKTAEVRMRNI